MGLLRHERKVSEYKRRQYCKGVGKVRGKQEIDTIGTELLKSKRV